MAQNTHHQNSEPAVERLFYPNSSAFVFAATRLSVHLHLPFYGMVVLSLDDEPVRIRLGDTVVEQHAMAIWCKDVRFESDSARFVCIAVNPLHADFRSFVRIGVAGAIELNRSSFRHLDPLMHAAMTSGYFAHDEVMQLLNGVLEQTRDQLPAPFKLDSRAAQLMLRVSRQPRVTLPELAQELGLSYHRTSHLFAQAVGIPARTYQLWQKLYRAGKPLMRGASLTEVALTAGFVDSAHYSNAFLHAYGRSPSEMLKVRRIVVFYRSRTDASVVSASVRGGPPLNISDVPLAANSG